MRTVQNAVWSTNIDICSFAPCFSSRKILFSQTCNSHRKFLQRFSQPSSLCIDVLARSHFLSINKTFLFLCVQVAKTVQEFEVPWCFLLLADIQRSCPRLAIYVSKSVNQKELCDGRARIICHVVPGRHATIFGHVLVIIRQDDARSRIFIFLAISRSFYFLAWNQWRPRDGIIHLIVASKYLKWKTFHWRPNEIIWYLAWSLLCNWID